jgi:hypothetical protein
MARQQNKGWLKAPKNSQYFSCLKVPFLKPHRENKKFCTLIELDSMLFLRFDFSANSP